MDYNKRDIHTLRHNLGYIQDFNRSRAYNTFLSWFGREYAVSINILDQNCPRMVHLTTSAFSTKQAKRVAESIVRELYFTTNIGSIQATPLPLL